MKKTKIIIAVALAMLLLAACGPTVAPDAPDSSEESSESVSESVSESASESASKSESESDGPVTPSDPKTLDEVGAKHTKVVASSDDGFSVVGLSYTDSEDCTDGWVAVDDDGNIVYSEYIDDPCEIECSNIASGNVAIRIIYSGSYKFLYLSLVDGEPLFETVDKVVYFGNIVSDIFWVAYMKGPLALSEYYVNYYDIDGNEMFVHEGYRGGDFNGGYAIYQNRGNRLVVVDEEGTETHLDASACAADFAEKYPNAVIDSVSIGAFEDIIPSFDDDGNAECTFVANFVYRESADSATIKAMSVKYTGTITTAGTASGVPDFDA